MEKSTLSLYRLENSFAKMFLLNKNYIFTNHINVEVLTDRRWKKDVHIYFSTETFNIFDWRVKESINKKTINQSIVITKLPWLFTNKLSWKFNKKLNLPKNIESLKYFITYSKNGNSMINKLNCNKNEKQLCKIN